MIKVNLLPQKRAKRGKREVAPRTDAAGLHLMFGVLGLLGAAAIVFLVFDLPARSDRADLEKKNKQLVAAIAEKQGELEGFDALQQQQEETIKRIKGIRRLVVNKVVPAHILHELGHILSTRGPTMTERVRRLTSNDPSKKFQQDWDPTHVWLISFVDQNGKFTLEGGAQSRDDITQLSKRLAASVHFSNIGLASGEPVTDRETNLSYYKFSITGKVAY